MLNGSDEEKRGAPPYYSAVPVWIKLNKNHTKIQKVVSQRSLQLVMDAVKSWIVNSPNICLESKETCRTQIHSHWWELKSVVVWDLSQLRHGVPMLHKMSLQRYKVSPFLFVVGVDSYSDYEIRWVTVNSDTGSYSPCCSLNTDSGFQTLQESLKINWGIKENFSN